MELFAAEFRRRCSTTLKRLLSDDSASWQCTITIYFGCFLMSDTAQYFRPYINHIDDPYNFFSVHNNIDERAIHSNHCESFFNIPLLSSPWFVLQTIFNYSFFYGNIFTSGVKLRISVVVGIMFIL